VDIDYTGLAIYRMAVADLDQLMEIESYSFPTPWKRAMYEHDLTQNKFSRFYVLKNAETGELAAYIGTWFIYEEAHVGTIASKKEFRGRRLAEQMLAYTALQALNEGLEYIILEVRVGNDPARRLYERLGFEQVGIRRKYYTDTGEDALLLVCHDMLGLSELLRIDEG
jgi:ribosomal-protein-alanine N-acetyltransferase